MCKSWTAPQALCAVSKSEKQCMHAMRALDTNAQLSGTKVNALVALLALRMLALGYQVVSY